MQTQVTTVFKDSKALGVSLQQEALVLALAESCTGGGVASAVTAVPGSSLYFDRGFVTYSNEAKQEMLGVSSELLKQHGAVSQEVAIAMAEGTLKHSKASVALAVTGVAGPGGGTIAKPVGCVWFALAGTHKSTQTHCKTFSGDRQSVREQAIGFSLKALLEYTQA